MKRHTRRLDPTRPVILAMNADWGKGASGAVDVQGCNYFIQNYDGFHAGSPHIPVLASENGSTVSTRGIYANDEVKGYVSAYDLNHPSWAHLAVDSWKAVAERPWMAGTFVWTGFDYRGEPTPYRWPCINSHFGILDTCGFAKDNFYYYQAWWSDRTVLHLLPHWNWPGREGQIIDVWAHSNCDEVELVLNGASQGRQIMPRNGHLEWKVPYAPGTLTATGFRDGVVIATVERRTTGEPARVSLQSDRPMLRADGEDICVINAAIVDATGLVVPTAGDMVRFSTNGNGHIIGVGNGDPSCHEPDKAMKRSAFNGLCQAIVQAGREEGTFTLNAEADGLAPAHLTIVMEACAPRASVPVIN